MRIDTTAARGEVEGAEFFRRLFECEEIETEVVCPAPGRCNVLARVPGRRRDGALLLLNHIDVVDAYAPYWKSAQPFEGKLEKGFLYGRGVYDMKSLGLAQALALVQLQRKGIVPETDILFLGEADEELGQKWGARWLLENRPDWFSGVAQVLNEGGTTEVILREPVFWGIETLQAGYALAEFETPDEPALKAFAAKHKKIPAPLFRASPSRRHGIRHDRQSPDAAAHGFRSGTWTACAPTPRSSRSFPTATEAFSSRARTGLQVYRHPAHPERGRMYVAISVPPGVSPGAFLQPILQEARQNGFTVLTTMIGEVGAASPYPTPFTDLLKRVTEARYPGVPFGPIPTYGGYTTSTLLRQKGIPTYGFQPIVTNITDTARRHGNDERIYPARLRERRVAAFGGGGGVRAIPARAGRSVRPVTWAKDVIGPAAA